MRQALNTYGGFKMAALNELRTAFVAMLIAIGILSHVGAALSQEVFEPIQLREEQMVRYIAALPEMAARANDVKNQLSAQVQSALAVIARKHGFTDPTEFKRMSDTITVVMGGIDPQTMAFTEPTIRLEQQIIYLTKVIGELRNEAQSLPKNSQIGDLEAELLPLEQLLDELKDGRGTLPEKTSPENVRLVQKYFVQLVSNAVPRRLN